MTHEIYLPQVARNSRLEPTIPAPPDEPPPPKPEPEPIPVQPEPEPGLLVPAVEHMPMEAYRLFVRMIGDVNQHRPELILHAILQAVAQARADYLVRINIGVNNQDLAVEHTDLDGLGPNWHVAQAGYVLPGWYPAARDANQIESLAYGVVDAAHAWRGFMASPGHQKHLLACVQGEPEHPNAMYRWQTRCGIGCAVLPNGRYVLVVLTAPPVGEERWGDG